MRIWTILAIALTAVGVAVWLVFLLALNEPILGSALCFAVLLAGQAMAMVGAARKQPAFQAQRIVQEVERGRRLAIYDPSSGLLAQWYFELRLIEETMRAKRYGLSLVVLTVTGSFAASDDEVSALGGNRTELSSIALRSVRQTDLVGSRGFSAFTICLTHCERAGAAPVVRRLMEALGDGDWQIGMAVYPDDDCQGRELIDLAGRRSVPWRLAAPGGTKMAA